MKKWLITLCMSLCLLSLTACGAKEEAPKLSDADALQEGIMDAQMLSSIIINDMVDEYAYQMEQQYGWGQMLKNACDSMEKSIDEMGNIVSGGEELVSNSVTLDSLGNYDEGSIQVLIHGEKKDAVFEVVFERGQYKSFTTNVKHTFAESMEKAGLNTLLGMGTVFCVLILISLIISAFNFIPKVQAAFKKKPAAVSEKAVDSAIAQIVQNEELSDDEELVAVISAAIASFEGTSSDGFYVRSIRRFR
ncbi:MAG: OadG family protein [Lachnospiraceae bacterium]|nr:OadG family protein [Lachnospiraceae bacterium]